jgi:hypothetical protein
MSMQSERRDELYLAALLGGSPSALLMRHMELHLLTVEEATEDWDHVLARLRIDSSVTPELELARVRAARWNVVSEANRRGQYLAAGSVLQHLGAAAGEATAALLGAVQGAPALRIVIEAGEAPQPRLEAAAVDVAPTESPQPVGQGHTTSS